MTIIDGVKLLMPVSDYMKRMVIGISFVVALAFALPAYATTATVAVGAVVTSLAIEGTNGSELIQVTGTGTYGEVWVDLNNNGVVNAGEAFTDIDLVTIFALDGNDLIYIESPLSCMSVNVVTGNGNDFVSIGGNAPMDAAVFFDSAFTSTSGNNFLSIDQLELSNLSCLLGGDSSLVQCTQVSCDSALLFSETGDSTFLFNKIVTDEFTYRALSNQTNNVHIALDNSFVANNFDIDASASVLTRLNTTILNSELGASNILGGEMRDRVEIRSSIVGATNIHTAQSDDIVIVIDCIASNGTFRIELGVGDDQLTVQDAHFSESVKLLGNSDDDIFHFNDILGGQITIEGDLDIRGGIGDDVLVAWNVVVGGNTQIFGGNGHDDFEVNNFRSTGSWICAMGNGQDLLGVFSSQFDGSFAAWGGVHFDIGNEGFNQFNGSRASGGFENGNL